MNLDVMAGHIAKMDQMRKVVRRLAQELSRLSSQVGGVRLVSEKPPHLESLLEMCMKETRSSDIYEPFETR